MIELKDGRTIVEDEDFEWVPASGDKEDPCKGCDFYDTFPCPLMGRCKSGRQARLNKTIIVNKLDTNEYNKQLTLF